MATFTSWEHYLSNTQELLRRAIWKSREDTHWDENSVTQRILEEFQANYHDVLVGREEGNTEVHARMKWRSFKLRETQKSSSCDIALIVNLQYPGSKGIEGVGLLEVKIKSETDTFDNMTIPELKTVLRNSPKALYLLYDYHGVQSWDFKEEWTGTNWLFLQKYESVTSLCVPADFLKNNWHTGTELYRHSIPFCAQLHDFYFRGLGLDYQKKILATAKGFPSKGTDWKPRYVITLSIGYRGASRIQTDVNQDIYERITGAD